MKRWVICFLCAVFFTGCGGTTRTRELGYKGKAKLDAYLAAARFLERYDHEVVNEAGWPELDYDVAMAIVPASVLSTDAYVREMAEWVADGGHLLCLVEYAESYHNDWSKYPRGFFDDDEMRYPEALAEWLEDHGIGLSEDEDNKAKAERLEVDGKSYEVSAEAAVGVGKNGGGRRVFAQVGFGEGLISVMTDARPFRNRYIDENDHAELLLALAESSPYEGRIVFVRDAGLSLWALLWERGWPVLSGLLAMTVFWLWKNMPRFGPTRREDGKSTLRDYDHHLEALGDFQWRLDKGAAMLRPLRELIQERAQHQAASLHRDDDLFEWMARRAGIPRERAERAMTHQHPADPASFTRLVTDLQLIHHSLS